MKRIGILLRTIRIEQWVKNVFVLCPVIFGGKLLSATHLCNSLIAVLCFCFAASAIYCLNDIRDVETDRLHEQKRKRPLASGEISDRQVKVVGLLMCALSLLLPFFLPDGWKLALVILAYLVLNVFYSFGLKTIPVLDVVIVAVGFVLRLLAGGVSSGVELSRWIVVMTFVLTLLIALGKRRSDVETFSRTGVKLRKNVSYYNVRFLDVSLWVLSAVTVLCYVLYTIDSEVVSRLNCNYLYVSAVFVVIGLARYLHLAVSDGRGGSPTKLVLTDKALLASVLGFFMFFLFVIYSGAK
ncbi:MAG: decaprenyl-phosphate phosphoribosyltransferase [Muribaculaceae bacterium]|nr:decaprenyl-phosphate phosphoribosyltransferase [Muribaculaceae bacterium]